MTDKELKTVAFGIMAYQTYLNEGKLPETFSSEVSVTVTPFCFKALYETIKYCAKLNLDEAEFNIERLPCGEEVENNGLSRDSHEAN